MKYRWAIVIALIFLSSALIGCVSNPSLLYGHKEPIRLRVGMSKAELASYIGYPPEGRLSPDLFFQGSTSSYTTNAGTLEKWRYDLGSTPDLNYMRMLTITMENGIVTEWDEGNRVF